MIENFKLEMNIRADLDQMWAKAQEIWANMTRPQRMRIINAMRAGAQGLRGLDEDLLRCIYSLATLSVSELTVRQSALNRDAIDYGGGGLQL